MTDRAIQQQQLRKCEIEDDRQENDGKMEEVAAVRLDHAALLSYNNLFDGPVSPLTISMDAEELQFRRSSPTTGKTHLALTLKAQTYCIEVLRFRGEPVVAQLTDARGLAETLHGLRHTCKSVEFRFMRSRTDDEKGAIHVVADLPAFGTLVMALEAKLTRADGAGTLVKSAARGEQKSFETVAR